MRMSIRATKKWAGGLLAVIVMSIAVLTLWPASAQAASGTVYSCTVNRMYQHPVTGVIEDSGGEESYSIGQGMVEGCVYPNGILEVTDDGRYYLTIRMSLMDYTSGHTFWVQTWGEDGWSTPAAGITGNGTDSNGTNADICIQVPSEQCVIRGAMYVEPMGRDVYWYMYPNNFSEGNNTDMNATMVTSASGSTQSSSAGTQSSSEGSDNSGQTAGQRADSNVSAGGSLSAGSQSLGSTGSSGSSGSTSVKPSALQSSANTAGDSEDGDTENGTENTLSGLNSTIGEPSATEAAPDTESVTNGAQGLSLSTAGEAGGEGDAQGAQSSLPGGQIMQKSLTVLIPGVILIAIAACVVYFFRKNWHKWGHAPDDNE